MHSRRNIRKGDLDLPRGDENRAHTAQLPANESASAVSADANGGEGADLVLGQSNVDNVALDPGDGPDRDGDLLPSPDVPALQDDVRDVLVRADHEAVHLVQ